MRTHDDIRVVIAAELLEERIRRRRAPEELVDPPRRSVDEQEAQASSLETDLVRQRSHPILVSLARVRRGVVVRDLRVVVVSRIGVAAMTVLRARRERLLVVPLNSANASRDQQLWNPIGMRPERAEVTEEVRD